MLLILLWALQVLMPAACRWPRREWSLRKCLLPCKPRPGHLPPRQKPRRSRYSSYNNVSWTIHTFFHRISNHPSHVPLQLHTSSPQLSRTTAPVPVVRLELKMLQVALCSTEAVAAIFAATVRAALGAAIVAARGGFALTDRLGTLTIFIYSLLSSEYSNLAFPFSRWH